MSASAPLVDVKVVKTMWLQERKWYNLSMSSSFSYTIYSCHRGVALRFKLRECLTNFGSAKRRNQTSFFFLQCSVHIGSEVKSGGFENVYKRYDNFFFF